MIVEGTIPGTILTRPAAQQATFAIRTPTAPLLRLYTDASDGKLHAEYDPAKLTDAALALIAEVNRLQT